jgi:hypothetical protein
MGFIIQIIIGAFCILAVVLVAAIIADKSKTKKK